MLVAFDCIGPQLESKIIFLRFKRGLVRRANFEHQACQNFPLPVLFSNKNVSYSQD